MSRLDIIREINIPMFAVISLNMLYFFAVSSVKAESPSFTNLSPATIWNVNEDAPVNYVIGTAAAADNEGDLPLLFTLSNSGGGPFSIDATYGSLRVNAPNTLNYRRTKAYAVTLRVTDSRREYTELSITVNVNDVNVSPIITITNVDVRMKEEEPPGVAVPFQFSASDPNVGTSLTYFLIGSDTAIFNIDQLTGDITLNTKVNVDPSPSKIYRPTLRASDGILSTSATLTLTIEDINDHAPVCIPMIIYRSVVEETFGALYSLSCTDEDSALNGNNVLTYTIISGDSNKFRASTMGAISLVSSLDYELTSLVILNVKVEDSASLGLKMSTTATVIVSVIPVNDNNPFWLPSLTANFTVSENVGVGTTIFTVAANDMDVDVGGTITYSIASVSDGTDPVMGAFNVDPSTGDVSTLSKLDADNGISQYIFDMRATDGGRGSHVITKTITLRLKDVNDHAPVFLGTPFAVITIPEASAKSGLHVRTVSATDRDVTMTSLTYNVEAIIQGDTDVSKWKFNTALPGQLELAADIDLDSGTSAISVLRLVVKDSGTPALTSTASLSVSIISDNEYPPIITSQPGAEIVVIPENRPIGTAVAEVIAADSDIGSEGVLSYSITGAGSENTFSVDSVGRITTRVLIDKETMPDLYKSVTATVTVSVTDVNDHRPSCKFLYQSVTLSESTQRDNTVAIISCTDADPDDNLTYSVRSPFDTTFGFTWPANQLKLFQGLDYDSAVQFYDVEVIVSDGTNSQAIKVKVNVGAVNEVTPTFTTNPSISVAENILSNPIILYTAQDADYSPHNIVSYSIHSVTNGGLSLFIIDSSSGEISLRNALDYDSLPATDKTFIIHVVATDGGALQGTGTISVTVTDVNDNSPVCIQSAYIINMNEKQLGPAPFVVLANLGCIDVESGAALAYTFRQAPGSHFRVTSNRVELVADTLDYEVSTSHTLTIRVTDSGIPVRTTTIIVYIAVVNMNEGPPVFPAFTPVFIDETIGTGQWVADVIAADPDALDPVFGDLQYSIIGGNALNRFSINTETGRISTRNILDFETVPSYNLLVEAKERGGANSVTATLIINLIDINDERPVCDQNVFSQTVPEDKSADYVVVNFACSDKDAGSVLVYTITNGNTNLFKMDGSQLKLRAQLDYDTYQSHDLRITVTDSLPSFNCIIMGTVYVGSVNEGPPVFLTNTFFVSVPESLPISTLVLTVLAADPDSTADTNGQVSYSFVSNYAQFFIDQNSGQILLAQKLDRETAAEHSLIVKAADATTFSTATVLIALLDSNDNSPKFTSSSYSGTVSESALAGTAILTVTATDLDDPETNNYGTVTYMLAESSIFAINPATGLITNTASLITSMGTNSYLLSVTAKDSGGLPGARTGSALVTIIVTSVNKYDPVFNPVTKSVTFAENQYTAGDIITTVTISDADTGANGEFDLSFVSPQTKFSLTHNGNVGQIILAQKLDFDNGDTMFTLEIKAADHGAISRSSTGTVIVIVKDGNNNAPLCPRVINVAKAEGETNITTLTCTDADVDSVLFYMIASTTPSTISPVVSAATRIVYVTTALDYERSTFHVIIIKVQDNGVPVQSTSVTVSLHIIDLNDNDPTLTGPFSFRILESEIASGAVLYKTIASSNDGPTDFLTYSISDTTYFDISSSYGEITLTTNAPDYETEGGSYTMDVCVVDSANPVARTACQTITVNITDVNDIAPVFDLTVYSASVPESAAVGTALTPVTASDADHSPAFRTIVYSIVTGAAGTWRISNTGTLTTTATLDYETKPSYMLVVQASDGLHNVTTNYNIDVTTVNEYDPVFMPATETIDVAENVALGTTLLVSAKATDGDKGIDGVLTYFIDPGPFMVNSITGIITVIRSLDRELVESYILNVRAVDKGAIPRTGILALTINVGDVNDMAPVCSSSMYSTAISENVAVGASITSLICQDDDNDPANISNALTYSTVSGDTTLFVIDTSGVIRSATIFDREIKSSYQVAVVVSDKSATNRLTFNVTVNVIIQDMNDNFPMFTLLPVKLLGEDTSIETTVGTVSAQDADEGVNSQLQFQITNGNLADMFFIDPSRGHIILHGKLDYETGPHIYQLEVTVMDKGSPVQVSVGTATVTVTDANDNAPVCATSFYAAIVPENSLNTLVTTVNCNDIDTVGTISYSIKPENKNVDFVINKATGTIKTSNSTAINYESDQFYTLTILASDGVQAATTLVKITVTDANEFSPQFSSPGLYSSTVPEDVAAGYIVANISATDSDTFDTVKIYSIIAGNEEDKFMVDSSSGQVKVQGILDYESRQLYRLRLQVEDSGGLTGTAVLNVTISDVNDNSPVCTIVSAAVNINEAVTTSSIYTPTCSDPDTGTSPTLGYSIVSGSHPAIGIESTTGELHLVGALNYEAVTFHDLTVQVTDKVLPTPRTTTFNIRINVIPVNEYDPTFTPSTNRTYSILESTATDTSIAHLTATDMDKGLRHGTVRYYITEGDPQQQFGIDQMTGNIKVIRALDREARSSYSLTVRAMDDEPGSTSQRVAFALVTVNVTDVNDCVPVFIPELYTVNVLENAPYGSTVVLQTLTVRDDDTEVYSTMTINIIGGNTEAKFKVSENSLILSGQLDYETTVYYELVLQVMDSGSPSLKSAGRVIITVLPVNENAPLMTSPNSVKSIPEDTPIGTLVFDANATDADVGMDGHITYSIVSGIRNNEFIINSLTGQLYVGSQLDYDTPSFTYSIIIQAADESGLTDAITSTVSLSIILLDVNDHIPQFPFIMFTFSVNENIPLGTSVGTVVATDKDSGLNGTITYTKIGGNGQSYFNIDNTLGLVTTAAAIDYEMFQTAYLSVQAQDGAIPFHKSNGLVKIQINNKNDNDPIITPQDFSVVVSEDLTVGSNVFIYTASDKDNAISGFHLDPTNSIFQVDASTGAVSTKVPLDREKVASYILKIEVIDQMTSLDPTIRTSTATLTVIIEDINDNDPVITRTCAPLVSEDSSINSLVCSITASDADVNENGQLTYSITAGNTGSAFRIDSVGNVQVAAFLDRESVPSYSLIILVSDKGTPPRTDQIDLSITIGDVNDNSPVFTQASYTFSVPENSNVDTSVGTPAAADADNGVNGSLTYSIDSIVRGPATHFTINATVGSISVAFQSLDREILATYVLKIKVTDAGTPFYRTTYTEVTINIEDINDNRPVFGSVSYNGLIEENSPLTMPIMKLVASDADVGPNAAITFSIETTLMDGLAADTYLKIDPTTGIISPKLNIDYESHQTFQFVVRATNEVTPPLTGTATVIITITDVNDNRPIFNPEFYNTEIAYSGQCQSVITTVTATDADLGNNGLISYSLETTAYSYLFFMNSLSGQLSLRSVAAQYVMHSLDIQASDAGSSTLTAVTAARVRVDTYMPNNQVVTFRLKINRQQFLAQKTTFITNLQAVIRNVYPSALVRLFCIEEYNDLADGKAGRRPVDVHMFVVRDDSSNSVSNMNNQKQYLTTDQFLSMVARNPEGAPSSNIQGAAWDYFRIQRVSQYYEKTDEWLEKPYVKAITFLVCLLGFFFLVLTTVFIIRYCCGRTGHRQTPMRKKHRIMGVVPKEVGAKQPKPVHVSDTYKDYVTDGKGQPYRNAFPPMLITDPESPPQNPNRPTSLTPSVYTQSHSPAMSIANDDPRLGYNIDASSRQFGGKAYDQATGKLYKYSTKKNQRRWI